MPSSEQGSTEGAPQLSPEEQAEVLRNMAQRYEKLLEGDPELVARRAAIESRLRAAIRPLLERARAAELLTAEDLATRINA